VPALLGPAKPILYTPAVVVVAAAGFVACVVPARRATRVDPSVALRLEA